MAKKKKVTRKHSVRATVELPELTKAGSSMEFHVYADHQKIGQLRIGRGGFFWWGRKRKNGKRISWSRFADIMDGVVYGKE